MSDSGASRSQHKGSRRQAHRRVGSTKPFHNFEPATNHQAFNPVGHTDQFGRGFEPQNGSYHPESGPVQDVQLSNNAARSESSESERISALHGNLHSRTLPKDTHGLQQYQADLQGELGRLTKVQDVVTAILHDRSESQRLSVELKEEREKANAAGELHRSRLAQAESNCKVEVAKARQLQQQVNELQEQERQLHHALYEAQQHVKNRESVLAHWKEEQRAADAEAARKVATAEAATGRAEEELRAAQAEISALHQSAAERQPEEERQKAEMVAMMDQWRGLVKGKEDEVSRLQQQVNNLQSQVWHFQSEIAQMDVHYRRELDALVASKALVDTELRELRKGAAVTGPALRLPQPAAVPLSFIPQPAALPGAQPEGRATPTPSTSRSVPQKGIKSGSMLDATQRSVAPELHLIMNGATPDTAPELLSEQQLVDALLDIVPRGEAHAKKLSQNDYQKLEASLGGRRWDQAYQAKYGSVADFMRTHPEAFYQSANGSFYRPEAPARLPPANNGAPSAGISTALIIPPGAAKAAVAPKRPAVISAVVTPAAPAHMRAKRAAGGSSGSANADAKQQAPPPQGQLQQEQPAPPARTLAVPVNVALGSGRPQKASEKGHAALAPSQPEKRSEGRKPEQVNGSAAPSKQQLGYLHAAKRTQAAPPKHSQAEYPELNGGSKDRHREAIAKEHKPGLSLPPGLPRPASGADRHNSAEEANGGSDRFAPGVSQRNEGEGDSNSREAAADGKGHAQSSASHQNGDGADKEKLKKKRSAKKVKSGSEAGIVGAP